MGGCCRGQRAHHAPGSRVGVHRHGLLDGSIQPRSAGTLGPATVARRTPARACSAACRDPVGAHRATRSRFLRRLGGLWRPLARLHVPGGHAGGSAAARGESRTRSLRGGCKGLEGAARQWGYLESPGRGMHLLSAALEAIEDFYEGDDGVDRTPFIGPPAVRVGGRCWCEG